MITKTSISGNVPTLIVSPSTAPNFLHIQNLSAVDLFLAVDGSSNVTTFTGTTPGIRVIPSGSWAAQKSFSFDFNPSRAVYGIFDGTGSYNVAVQKY